MTTVKVSYKAVYNRRKQLDRNGKASVLIEAYQNGKRRYLKTGIHLSTNEWDERTKEVKKRPELNRLIRNKITELEQFELTFSVTVRRQVKVDKRGGNGKRQFSKLFHSNHLGYVQFNQKIP